MARVKADRVGANGAQLDTASTQQLRQVEQETQAAIDFSEDAILPTVRAERKVRTNEERASIDEWLNTVSQSEAYAILFAALEFAGDTDKLQPEHVAMALMQAQGIQDAAVTKALSDAAMAHAEPANDGGSLSDAVADLVLDIKDAAGLASPTAGNVISALRASGDPNVASCLPLLPESSVDAAPVGGTVPIGLRGATDLGLLGRASVDITRQIADKRYAVLFEGGEDYKARGWGMLERGFHSFAFVGPSRVGKTALVYAMAKDVVDGKAPPGHETSRFLKINIAALEDESRPPSSKTKVMDEVARICVEAAGKGVRLKLFFDEMEEIQESQLGLFRELKKRLDEPDLNGMIEVIATLTPEKYSLVTADDVQKQSRLPALRVEPPPADELVNIVEVRGQDFAARRRVPYEESAATMAIALAKKYNKPFADSKNSMASPGADLALLEGAAQMVQAELLDTTKSCDAIRTLNARQKSLGAAIARIENGVQPGTPEALKSSLRHMRRELGEVTEEIRTLKTEEGKQRKFLARIEGAAQALERATGQQKATQSSAHAKLDDLQKELAAAQREWDDIPVDKRLFSAVLDGAAVARYVAREFEKKNLKAVLDYLLMQDPSKMADIVAELDKTVIGQSHAKEALANAVLRRRMGVSKKRGVMAAIVEQGPSGVGKTHMGRQLAKVAFRGAMEEIDGSQFQQKHTITDLIGSPKSFVGWSAEGGLLVKMQRKHMREHDGYAVYQFNDAHFFHPDIWTHLMNIIDDGGMWHETDAGREWIDFSNALFKFTGNLGNLQILRPHTTKDGRYDNRDQVVAEMTTLVKNSYPPELWARITDFLVYDPQSLEELTEVARLEVDIRKELAAAQGVKLTATPEALHAIAEEALALGNNGRGIEKPLLPNYVETPLAKMLQKTPDGGFSVELAVVGGAVVLREVENTAEKPKSKPEEEQDAKQEKKAGSKQRPEPKKKAAKRSDPSRSKGAK
jgi:ATP-dependent Clp protease ATP-binding subunit ClpB